MGEFVRLEVADGVGTLRLDRPKMNALNVQVQEEIRAAATEAGERDDVKAVVVYGGEKVFAAGADIKEMADMQYVDMVRRSGALQSSFSAVARIPKPVIAADNAKFGQPEINLGIGPGAGGTQRLTRAVGKAKAMDLCLTGRMMDAAEAERSGLVARVVPLAELMAEALKCAQKIASASLASTMMIKESVNAAYETTLSQGIHLERRLFHAMFATEDQKEGMAAFVDKRKPSFKDR